MAKLTEWFMVRFLLSQHQTYPFQCFDLEIETPWQHQVLLFLRSCIVKPEKGREKRWDHIISTQDIETLCDKAFFVYAPHHLQL